MSWSLPCACRIRVESRRSSPHPGRERRLRSAVAIGWMLACLASGLSAQRQGGLLLEVGSRKSTVGVERRSGKAYVSLQDIISALRLEGGESKDRFRLSGPGDELLFLDGRPLVRAGRDYLLMSDAAWKKGPSDWYIPENFLVRALAPVLPGRLSRTGARRYRFEPRDLNRVKVEVTNHPNHVRIVFSASRSGPIRVRDRRDYLEVEFGPYRVRPGSSRGTASPGLVSALKFNSGDPFGTFRIHKGEGYRRYREDGGDGGSTRVVEVHGVVRPAPSRASRADPAAVDPDPAPARQPRLTRSRNRLEAPVIVVDPGHGGTDSGGIWEGDLGEQGFVEKDLTLQLALKLRDEFRKRGLEMVLTRDRDVRLSAARRSSVGNSNRTRVYLSLHLGRAPDEELRGGVVYVHGTSAVMPLPEEDPAQESMVLRNGEAPDLPPPESEAAEELAAGRTDPGPTPEDEEKFILWESGQERHRARSRELAAAVQESLNTVYGTKNRVVEVPLTVLRSVASPGILVEFGQLTNSEDRRNLTLESFHRRLVSALAAACAAFLEGSRGGGDPR